MVESIPTGQRWGLQRLLPAMGITPSGMDDFLRLFSTDLLNYHELSLDPHQAIVGLGTKGSGAGFVKRGLGLMSDLGAQTTFTELIWNRSELCSHLNHFLRLEISADGKLRHSCHMRGRFAVPFASRWLRLEQKIAAEETALQEILKVMGGQPLHFLALADTAGEPPISKLYWMLEGRSEDWTRIESVGTMSGLVAPLRTQIEEQAGPLGGRRVFLSVDLIGGVPQRGLKLDFVRFTRQQVEQLLAAWDAPAASNTNAFFAATQPDRCDNLGLRFSPDGSVKLRLYSHRHRGE